jgi:hypothetical protein
VAVDHAAGIGVKAVSPRRVRAPAGFRHDDRVRLAGQNALHCSAELRPVAAAARLILIPQHIDKLYPWFLPVRWRLARWIASVWYSGSDRLPALEMRMHVSAPLSAVGQPSSLCCALLVFRIV